MNYEDDLCEDDYDSDDDAYGDEDEAERLPCPACGAEIYEDAEQCPVCGEYVTFSTHPFQGRSIVWIVLGGLGVCAVIFALIAVG